MVASKSQYKLFNMARAYLNGDLRTDNMPAELLDKVKQAAAMGIEELDKQLQVSYETLPETVGDEQPINESKYVNASLTAETAAEKSFIEAHDDSANYEARKDDFLKLYAMFEEQGITDEDILVSFRKLSNEDKQKALRYVGVVILPVNEGKVMSQAGYKFIDRARAFKNRAAANGKNFVKDIFTLDSANPDFIADLVAMAQEDDKVLAEMLDVEYDKLPATVKDDKYVTECDKYKNEDIMAAVDNAIAAKNEEPIDAATVITESKKRRLPKKFVLASMAEDGAITIAEPKVELDVNDDGTVILKDEDGNEIKPMVTESKKRRSAKKFILASLDESETEPVPVAELDENGKPIEVTAVLPSDDDANKVVTEAKTPEEFHKIIAGLNFDKLKLVKTDNTAFNAELTSQAKALGFELTESDVADLSAKIASYVNESADAILPLTEADIQPSFLFTFAADPNTQYQVVNLVGNIVTYKAFPDGTEDTMPIQDFLKDAVKAIETVTLVAEDAIMVTESITIKSMHKFVNESMESGELEKDIETDDDDDDDEKPEYVTASVEADGSVEVKLDETGKPTPIPTDADGNPIVPEDDKAYVTASVDETGEVKIDTDTAGKPIVAELDEQGNPIMPKIVTESKATRSKGRRVFVLASLEENAEAVVVVDEETKEPVVIPAPVDEALKNELVVESKSKPFAQAKVGDKAVHYTGEVVTILAKAIGIKEYSKVAKYDTAQTFEDDVMAMYTGKELADLPIVAVKYKDGKTAVHVYNGDEGIYVVESAGFKCKSLNQFVTETLGEPSEEDDMVTEAGEETVESVKQQLQDAMSSGDYDLVATLAGKLKGLEAKAEADKAATEVSKPVNESKHAKILILAPPSKSYYDKYMYGNIPESYYDVVAHWRQYAADWSGASLADVNKEISVASKALNNGIKAAGHELVFLNYLKTLFE